MGRASKGLGRERGPRRAPRDGVGIGERRRGVMVSWEQVVLAFVLGAVVMLLWRRGLG
jgi:hypothetical protein